MKKTFKICGMHCNACAMLLEQEFESKKGIKKFSVNYCTEKAEVDFDEKVISENEIMKLIKNSGFEAK